MILEIDDLYCNLIKETIINAKKETPTVEIKNADKKINQIKQK